jgi:hypothetical protein
MYEEDMYEEYDKVTPKFQSQYYFLAETISKINNKKYQFYTFERKLQV